MDFMNGGRNDRHFCEIFAVTMHEANILLL